jgi:hypothetical protein
MYPVKGAVYDASGKPFYATGISLGNTSAAPYANLYGDAANTLALRNGGTAGTPAPQAFYLYNFCDGAACATGYERGGIYWESNILKIIPSKAGTGMARALWLGYDGVGRVALDAPGGVTVLRPLADDSYDTGYSATQWRNSYIARSIQGSKSKALTDAGAAVAVIRVPVATNGYQGGEVIWNAQSTDATDYRATEGRIRFAAISKAATPTCAVNVVGTDLTASSNANTLVCTWTNVVNTTNCDLSVACVDNTAGTQTMSVFFRADMPTTATLVFP